MRLLPNSSHVEMTEGGVWSLPFDHPDGGLEWRLRYANPEQLVKDRFLAASVVDCYRTLIMLPEKRRRSVIRQLRAAMIQDHKRQMAVADGGGEHE